MILKVSRLQTALEGIQLLNPALLALAHSLLSPKGTLALHIDLVDPEEFLLLPREDVLK
jgi:hypothetical protein